MAKSGCCDICKRLDDWYTVEEEDIEPYEIKQHNFCRCVWAMSWIEGLWADMREQIINRHADIAQQYYDAAVEIAAWEDKIAEAEQELATAKEDKSTEDANAVEWQRRADENIDAAQRMIDENEELTEELQEWVDELLLQAEDFIVKAEDAISRSDELQQEIHEANNRVRNGYDQKDAEEYRKQEALNKLTELEPCLTLGTIEDMVKEIAGSRLTFEF